MSFFYKDEPYLADIRQKVLETIFNELSRREFASLVEDSFRKWVYKITYFACMNADKKRRAEDPLTSEVFTNEETNLADLMLIQTTPRTTDYEEVEEQLNNILPKLSGPEKKLMELVGKKVPYKKIRKLREFKRYSIDYLMRKVYNIRKRMREK
jgi:DNA-directed RNA polymerase specialized sigma24 family protein